MSIPAYRMNRAVSMNSLNGFYTNRPVKVIGDEPGFFGRVYLWLVRNNYL